MSCEGALQTLGAARAVACCALSADGARLAAGAARALLVWRWEAGAGWREAAREPAAHRHPVTRLLWADFVVSAGIDGAIRLWSEQLEPLGSAAAPGAAAVRALRAAGGRLAAGHDDGAVSLWAAPPLRLLAVLRAHAGAVAALALHARLLVSVCSQSVLKVHDLHELITLGGGRGVEVRAAPLQWRDGVHDLGALCAAAAPRRVATGGQDGCISVWRAGRRRLFHLSSLSHGAPVTALAWARRTLASAGLDGSAKLWRGGRCTRHVAAHAQFLTDVALDGRLRFLVTASNDRSLRMWALGDMTVDEEIQMPCDRSEHYGLGDLEGIEALPAVAAAARAPGPRCAWEGAVGAAAHALHAHADLIAVAVGEGGVRILRREGDGSLTPETSIGSATRAEGTRAVCLSRGLLTAGGGGGAWLADVAGAPLASLPAAEVYEARVAARGGDTLLLLAAEPPAVWSLPSLRLLHAYTADTGMAGARCCAWSADGRAAVLGGCGGGGDAGALAVVAPPAPAVLAAAPLAHDLGILSMDFSESAEPGLAQERRLLLLTVGSDCYLKLWFIDYLKNKSRATLTEAWSVWAHGGAAAAVRARGALCGTAGDDGWARVWRVAAAPALLHCVHGPGGAGSPLAGVAWLPPSAPHPAPALALAALSGRLAVWELPDCGAPETDEEDGLAPGQWTAVGVARWLKDYVTRVPGEEMPAEEEAQILKQAESLTGSDLLERSAETIIRKLGLFDEIDSAIDVSVSSTLEDSETTGEEDRSVNLLDDDEVSAGTPGGAGGSPRGAGAGAVRRLREELRWLKREPSHKAEDAAPHRLRCPLSHRVLRSPARAADGLTYGRRAAAARLALGRATLAAGPLAHARLAPNRALRTELRQFLRSVDGEAAADRSDSDSEGDW